MPATLTIAIEAESSLDVLLDIATASGGSVTWGRARLMRRHWVAVQLPDRRARVRRAPTRAEAARRLLRDIYREA
jgi:hypothetical protein